MRPVWAVVCTTPTARMQYGGALARVLRRPSLSNMVQITVAQVDSKSTHAVPGFLQ